MTNPSVDPKLLQVLFRLMPMAARPDFGKSVDMRLDADESDSL